MPKKAEPINLDPIATRTESNRIGRLVKVPWICTECGSALSSYGKNERWYCTSCWIEAWNAARREE